MEWRECGKLENGAEYEEGWTNVHAVIPAVGPV